MTLCDLGATELRALIAARKASPVEALKDCLARVAAIDHAVNAVVALDEEAAFAAARAAEDAIMRGETPGALQGLPILIKD